MFLMRNLDRKPFGSNSDRIFQIHLLSKWAIDFENNFKKNTFTKLFSAELSAGIKAGSNRNSELTVRHIIIDA